MDPYSSGVLLALMNFAQQTGGSEEEPTGVGLLIVGVILLIFLALCLLALYVLFRLVRGVVRRARN